MPPGTLPLVPSGQRFSNFTLLHNHLEGLGKHRLLGSALRAYDSVGLEWGSIICISNKFPGNVDAAGARIHFRTTALENAAEIHLRGY